MCSEMSYCLGQVNSLNEEFIYLHTVRDFMPHMANKQQKRCSQLKNDENFCKEKGISSRKTIGFYTNNVSTC